MNIDALYHHRYSILNDTILYIYDTMHVTGIIDTLYIRNL